MDPIKPSSSSTTTSDTQTEPVSPEGEAFGRNVKSSPVEPTGGMLGDGVEKQKLLTEGRVVTPAYSSGRRLHTDESSMGSMGSISSLDSEGSDNAFDDPPSAQSNEKGKGLLTRQRSVSESGTTDRGRRRSRSPRRGSYSGGGYSRHGLDSSPLVRSTLFRNSMHALDFQSQGEVTRWLESVDKRRDDAAQQLLKELQQTKPEATRADIEFEPLMRRTMRGVTFGKQDLGLIVSLNNQSDQRNLVSSIKLHIAKDILHLCATDAQSSGQRLVDRDEEARHEGYQARLQYLTDLEKMISFEKLQKNISRIIGRPYVLKQDLRELKEQLKTVSDHSASSMIKEIDQFFADEGKSKDIVAVNKFVIKMSEKLSNLKVTSDRNFFQAWPNKYKVPVF